MEYSDVLLLVDENDLFSTFLFFSMWFYAKCMTWQQRYREKEAGVESHHGKKNEWSEEGPF